MSAVNPGKMRLNRFLARAGLGSRRDVESLITTGRISINSVTVTGLATYVNPGSDTVLCDGNPVILPGFVYLKCYKPRGILTTMDDTHGRRTIADLLKSKNYPLGVVPAGRLDMDSEGLLILSNDGDLVNFLTHPGHGIQKVYRVLIDATPSEKNLNTLRNGIKCEEFFAKPESVFRMGPQPKGEEHPDGGYWLDIILVEGKKREIREMLKNIGHSVRRLIRISHGPIHVGTLLPGEITTLSDEELRAINNLIALKSEQKENAPG